MSDAPQSSGHAPFAVRPRWWWLAPGLVLAVVLYYAVGMRLAHVVDADPDFAPGPVAAGQSRAAAMAAQLIFREVDRHRWVANDPFFQPSAVLDDMPAFQIGMVGAIERFARTLDGLAADAGGGPDANLARAAGLLKYPGRVWMFDPRTSWAPTASSEKQYRSAARDLVLFNDRLQAGEARFERSPEALAALLAAARDDLDALAETAHAHSEAVSWPLFDGDADDLFFAARGRAYAWSLLLRELGWDFAPLLAQRDLGSEWGAMLDSLRAAARLDPVAVFAARPDATFLPSHLAGQGFLLLRARAQTADLAAALSR
ncbi:DUF2333 family protein [Magnetospirillum sp. UT-4]|uniref:DUF2333 family protein n=1 Tax=Magnetospirillum sp. UT-4 TaxID=2681467 RepID=UPI0013832476|nr:DUF2333 family protein [Magnetospirillum sp. UT-4]CAA7616333.1 Protein conserved in bacteria [Magnetospirillum sp. UT-4]